MMSLFNDWLNLKLVILIYSLYIEIYSHKSLLITPNRVSNELFNKMCNLQVITFVSCNGKFIFQINWLTFKDLYIIRQIAVNVNTYKKLNFLVMRLIRHVVGTCVEINTISLLHDCTQQNYQIL